MEKLSKNQVILQLILRTKAKAVAEIGVYRGKLIEYVFKSKAARAQIEEYHAIDSYPKDMIKCCKALKKVPPDDVYNAVKGWLESRNYIDWKVKFIRKDSSIASLDYIDEYFDLVFIDADHRREGFTADIRAWFPKVKVGGILCGHDYGNPYWPVKEIVDEIFGDEIKIWKPFFVWATRKLEHGNHSRTLQ